MKLRRATLFEEAAFEALLARLDRDRERAGEKYEVLRRRLIQLLAWRGSWRPEELADETLNRAGRSLQAGDPVRSLEEYCGGIARLVVLEDIRNLKEVPLAERHANRPAAASEDAHDARSAAFDECLSRMTVSHRDLILQYYGGEGGEKIRSRKGLARKLGIPLNALRIRAYRIRAALDRCIQGKLHPQEDR